MFFFSFKKKKGSAACNGSSLPVGRSSKIKLSTWRVLSLDLQCPFPLWLWCVLEIKQRSKAALSVTEWEYRVSFSSASVCCFDLSSKIRYTVYISFWVFHWRCKLTLHARWYVYQILWIYLICPSDIKHIESVCKEEVKLETWLCDHLSVILIFYCC